MTAATNAGGSVEVWTERELLNRLRVRHGRCSGNGPDWAFMEHVRDDAAHYAGTTIDALAIHMWPSRHHEAHAFEVKCSRADFRRELENDCAKSASWRRWVEHFWIVAPVGVVPVEELPGGWGLLVPHGRSLKVARPAKRLRPKPLLNRAEDALPRGLVVAILRAQVRTASKVDGYWRSLNEAAIDVSA